MEKKDIINNKENLKIYIKTVLIYTSFIVSAVLLSWVILALSKEISYVFIYEDKVKDTIIKSVKPEYLQENIIKYKLSKEKIK